MIKGPKPIDVTDELISQDGQTRISFRQWKDKVQVEAEYLGKRYIFSVLPTDIKYVPDKLFDSENWIEFYREVVPLVGKEEFERKIREVGQKVYNNTKKNPRK